MHKKTISKILVAILLTSMLIAIVPTLPVAATSISSLTPATGNVGDTVRLVGSIDTSGGAYSIWFDVDDDGNAYLDTLLKAANAADGSLLVNTTFVVPPCVGTDAGNGHTVTLRDDSSGGMFNAVFTVQTERTIIVAPQTQEGNQVSINMTVTGGIANTLNNFTLTVTDPAGTMTDNFDVSFTTNGVGSGFSLTSFPADYTAGASSNYTGAYTVVADRKQPGVINDAATASFNVGLTDKTSYGRFETVNVQTAGWANNQNVTITIRNPSGTIVRQWVNQNLPDGLFTGTYVIPVNAELGTYTITAVNATGVNKLIASTQTFTVGSANLAVAFTVNPGSPAQRTDTVFANFTVQYPDSTYLNATLFSSITVSVFYNNTLVTTIPLTTAAFNAPTNSWRVSWKIPRNASLGIGYKFVLGVGAISDTNGNSGPTAAVSSGTFVVNAAVLTVKVVNQPAANYTRQQAAISRINITYPDNSFFTAADLGTIMVRAYQGATNFANLTLAASAFNATTNIWTISWVSGYNQTLATDYMFTVPVGGATDVSGNSNTAPVSTNTFALLRAVLSVPSISTGASSYERGEFVQIFFDATYPDGSPVVTGTSSITVLAPDGFTATTLNPVHTTNARWAVTWWASEAVQVGSYNVTLSTNALSDGATPVNMGPTATRMTSFTILPSDVTLASLGAAIEDLSDRLDDIEADTGSLTSQVSTLFSTVTSLQDLVETLQTQLDSLSSSAATDADVAAVNSAVNSLSSDLATLRSTLNSVQSSVANAATESDVAAVNTAVNTLSSDVAALETSLNNLQTAVDNAATPAEVEAAVNDAVGGVSDNVGGLSTLVIVAIVLALIAAVAAIAAVYIIMKKIAG